MIHINKTSILKCPWNKKNIICLSCCPSRPKATCYYYYLLASSSLVYIHCYLRRRQKLGMIQRWGRLINKFSCQIIWGLHMQYWRIMKRKNTIASKEHSRVIWTIQMQFKHYEPCGAITCNLQLNETEHKQAF